MEVNADEIEKKINSTSKYIKVFYILLLVTFATILIVVILDINLDAITTVSWPFALLFFLYLCGIAQAVLGVIGVIKSSKNFRFIKKLSDEHVSRKAVLKRLSTHLMILCIAFLLIYLAINIF